MIIFLFLLKISNLWAMELNHNCFTYTIDLNQMKVQPKFNKICAQFPKLDDGISFVATEDNVYYIRFESHATNLCQVRLDMINELKINNGKEITKWKGIDNLSILITQSVKFHFLMVDIDQNGRKCTPYPHFTRIKRFNLTSSKVHTGFMAVSLHGPSLYFWDEDFSKINKIINFNLNERIIDAELTGSGNLIVLSVGQEAGRIYSCINQYDYLGITVMARNCDFKYSDNQFLVVNKDEIHVLHRFDTKWEIQSLVDNRAQNVRDLLFKKN